jgi:hypothetical protein
MGTNPFGQLKLLISEIEFLSQILTPFYGEEFYVVYAPAGAAPGVHMPIFKLADIFPSMHFILVDPAPSMIVNGRYHNIEVIEDFMTDTLSRQFASRCGDKILFITDIRIGADHADESDRQQQERIYRDRWSD